jgi:hypothetical protein
VIVTIIVRDLQVDVRTRDFSLTSIANVLRHFVISFLELARATSPGHFGPLRAAPAYSVFLARAPEKDVDSSETVPSSEAGRFGTVQEDRLTTPSGLLAEREPSILNRFEDSCRDDLLLIRARPGTARQLS